jgi:L-iditol 2-dehydrogenase
MPDSSVELMEVTGVIISNALDVQIRHFCCPKPANDELVVKVELCGICTPEQRVYRGTKAVYPYWGGHELCGIVQDLPSNYRGAIRRGDRVAVALMRRCGKCHACRVGLDNHCAYINPQSRLGLPSGPGGLADRIVIQPYKAFVIPSTIPAERAALAEPIACVLRSIDRAALQSGAFVAVIGAGTMGLIHTALLTLKGYQVFVVDDNIGSYGQALAAGASHVGPISDLSSLTTTKAFNGGWGFDAMFCTRSGPHAIEGAVSAMARGGRIVLYQSIQDSAAITLDANLFHYRELQLIGTIAQTERDFAGAIQTLTDHSAKFDFLRVEVVSMERSAEAYKRSIQPQINRVLIDFR